MIVELRGLAIFGHHGAGEEERDRGQVFLYDLELEVGERGLSDRIEDAVDYRDVASATKEVSESHRFHLLEALAPAVADALVARFPVEWVRVRVRKPEVRPIGLEVEYSGVTVERRRP
ncbi:MAG TPA: dihydroneopterin aldolase [Gaiellaceae bacterium]|nr:dihydroneopterin aldolase [Gaiellaceae bacterium]